MFKTLISLMLAVLLAATLYWQLQTPDVPTIKPIHPERGEKRKVNDLTGKVINDRTVTLSALVNGQITEMIISKGQVVSQDQVLARFDRREADAELERLRAEQELAEQKTILARQTLDRLLNMGAGGNVSQQQIDDAQTEWRIATAQLKVSKAAYRIAAIQREKFDVTAPFDGVITEKTTEVGQWVEAGTPLFTLVALRGREIEVNIDSSDRGQVRLDQVAMLVSEAWPEQPWSESIHWLAPAVATRDSEALNSFTARLTLGPDAPPLILGQQVDVELIIEQKADALKIPYEALIESEGSRKVAVIDSAKRIQLRDIVTGIEDITFVEVISGIDGDERLAPVLEQAYVSGQTVSVE